jgi:hypothetical protein
MVRATLLILVAGLVGCRSFSASPSALGPPPPQDSPPASLGPNGVVVDQPEAAATVDGSWVAVTGWLDPRKYGGVLVVGGDNPNFYTVGSGHGSIPFAPFVLGANGRFVAPRVPLDDGGTTISVVPFLLNGTRPPEDAIVQVEVTNTHPTSVPATLVAKPSSGMMPLTTLLQAFGASGSGDWEWDFDGDGVFDATAADGAKVSHTYAHPGEFTAMARRKVEGRWVYATARVAVASEPQVLADAPAQDPHAIAIDVDYEAWLSADQRRMDFHDGGYPPDDANAYVRRVILADGDSVRVLDADLHEVLKLGGFSHPAGVAVDDQRRIYVADTGNNRVQRFNADGTLDSSFATQGTLSGFGAQSLSAPTSIVLAFEGPHRPGGTSTMSLLVLDSGHGQVVTCDVQGQGCTAKAPKVVHEGITGPTKTTETLAVLASEASRLRYASLNLLASSGTDVQLTHDNGSWQSGVFAVRGTGRTGLQGLVGSFDLGLQDHYAMGADQDGVLHEWVLGMEGAPGSLHERRKTALSFPVRTLAFDPWGWWVLHRRADKQSPDGWIHGETGPLVFYVAGPGHVQRRIFDSMKEPFW